MNKLLVLVLASLTCSLSQASAQKPGVVFLDSDKASLDTLFISASDTESAWILFLASVGTAKTSIDSVSVLANHPEAFHITVKRSNLEPVNFPDSLLPAETWEITLSSRSWLIASGDTCRIVLVSSKAERASVVVQLRQEIAAARNARQSSHIMRQTSESLTILSSQVQVVDIYDACGRLIQSAHEPEVPLRDLPLGFYVARIRMRDNSEYLAKFLH